MIPPSVTGCESFALTARIESPWTGSVYGSGKPWAFVATYVAIEMPPAWKYSTRLYVLPTRWKPAGRSSHSVTEWIILVEPSQKNDTTIASPWCGFVGLNPLMSTVPFSCSVPFSWLRTMPPAGGDVMLNDALVAPLRPVAMACSVYPMSGLSKLRPENVAPPVLAATGFEPEGVAPPGFAPHAIRVEPANVGSGVPALASS